MTRSRGRVGHRQVGDGRARIASTDQRLHRRRDSPEDHGRLRRPALEERQLRSGRLRQLLIGVPDEVVEDDGSVPWRLLQDEGHDQAVPLHAVSVTHGREEAGVEQTRRGRFDVSLGDQRVGAETADGEHAGLGQLAEPGELDPGELIGAQRGLSSCDRVRQGPADRGVPGAQEDQRGREDPGRTEHTQRAIVDIRRVAVKPPGREVHDSGAVAASTVTSAIPRRSSRR